MNIKKIITLIVLTAVTFTSLPLYAAGQESQEAVKYDKELYYIGADIPVDAYVVISKDVTKPAFAGIYTNNLGKGAQFVKKQKVLIGSSEDYIYPHYFENNDFYNTENFSVSDNQGECCFSQYFEYSAYVDLSAYKHLGARKDFLYLENCYAVSVKELNKIDIDFNRDGFMPLSNFVNKEQTYRLTIDENERIGFFACYKYEKFSKKLLLLDSLVIMNRLYNSGKSDYIYGSRLLTIPEDTDVILKIGLNVEDTSGNVLYPYQGITYPESFTEKYNFSDVSNPLKTAAIQEFKGLREEEIALRNMPAAFTKSTTETAIDRRRIFKNLEGFAKTSADYEYVKYVREAYAMYAQSPYADILLGKYLYNASSFEDLSVLLRSMAYNDYRSKYYQYTLNSELSTSETTEEY